MFDTLLSPIAPHLCCGCGKTGTLLCDYCKYDIAQSALIGCILCSNKYTNHTICTACHMVAQRGWCVAERTDALRRLIDVYKFENARSAYRTLAELLHEHIDQLPPTTVIVPIPTVTSHIRQRGYDHTALLAKAFAKRRQLAYKPLVRRITTTSQRNATKAQRLQQANAAFKVSKPLSSLTPYLLVDDIVTTGATLTSAAKALRAAGAQEVWVAAVARQPLD